MNTWRLVVDIFEPGLEEYRSCVSVRRKDEKRPRGTSRPI